MQVSSVAREIPRKLDWRWLMPLGAAALAVVLWGFATRVQGAEQKAPVYQAPTAVAVKTAQVATGPLSTSLSYTGDVKAASQVNVVPQASGQIQKLLVDVGSRVKKGDVIAELDSSALKAQASQARANLAAAQARYDNLQAGPRSEQVAQARANLDGARAKLAAMEAGGRGEQVAQAQAALEAARAKAATVHKGATDADLQAAESALDAAKGSVQTARARLEQVKQGPTQTDWGNALGAVDSARANMQASQARLGDVKAGAKQADIAAAEAAVVQAKAQVAAADDLKELMDLPEQQRLAAGATSMEKVNRQSAAAQAAYEAAEAKLALIRSMPLAVDVQAAQSAYDAARASFEAAAARVDQMKRGPTKEDIQQADGAVIGAEAAVASAEARLKQMKDGPTEEDLAQIDSVVAQAEQALALVQKPFRDEDLMQAQAAVTVAQQAYLLAQNPYTRFDLAMAQATVQQAESAVELAEIALSYATVASPVDGVVWEKLQPQGALVSPPTSIVSVLSNDVEVVLGVEESQIGQITEGQKAEIGVAGYPGVAFPAKVAVISPAADSKSRTFQVKVRPIDSDGRLRQGMFAQVKVVTQEKERAILVPREAVVTRSGQTSVFAVKGDTVQLRPIKVGVASGGSVEVVSGLDAGEEVVVAGQNDLRDGDKVRKP